MSNTATTTETTDTITVKMTSTNRSFVIKAVDTSGANVHFTQTSVTGSTAALRKVFHALEATRERNGSLQSFKFITKRIGVAAGER